MPIIDPDRDPALDPDNGLTPYQRAQSWLYMMWMDVYHKCIAMIEQMILDGTLGAGGLAQAATYPTGDTLSDQTSETTVSNPTVLLLPDGTLLKDGTVATKIAYKPRGGAYCELSGISTVVNITFSGPTNVWGDSIIQTIVFSADVECTITLTPGDDHTFGAGGGTYTASSLDIAWAEGVQIAASVETLDIGGTYASATIGYRYA